MSRAAASQVRQRQDPRHVGEVFPELAEALMEARALRPGPAGDAYERAAMRDATTALLIRHGLPLDAEEIAAAVEDAAGDPEETPEYAYRWAIGCAEYIAGVADHGVGGREK